MKSLKKAESHQVNKYIESKMLITTNSLQPLLSNMDGRFELIKEFNREFNQKYVTNRKHTPQKGLSSSSAKSKKSLHAPVEPKRLFDDPSSSRYNEIYEKLLEEKKTGMRLQEIMLKVKSELLLFLSSPTEKAATQLLAVLDNEGIARQVRRMIQNQKRLGAMEVVMSEMKQLLQRDSPQGVLEAVRERVERNRNLDQTTYRVLELESQNKRLLLHLEEAARRNRKQSEAGSLKQLNHCQTEVERLKTVVKKTQESASIAVNTQSQLQQDISLLLHNWELRKLDWKADCRDLREIHGVILELSGKLDGIEVDAEENMFKLLKANEEMLRIQRLMEELRREMGQQMEEDQLKCDALDQIIRGKEEQIGKYRAVITGLQEQMQETKDVHSRKLKQVADEYSSIAIGLQIEDVTPSRVILKVQEIKRNQALKEQENGELRTALHGSEARIKQLSKQVEAMQKGANQSSEFQRTLALEKDEYKFLLNNVREQVIELKRIHKEELARVAREKDGEYLLGNRDILESNAVLCQENAKVKVELRELQVDMIGCKAQLGFQQKKSAQLETAYATKMQEIEALFKEKEKYRKYLQEIESSFKEVVENEELSSMKVIKLEDENKSICQKVLEMQTKNAELERSQAQLIYQYNTNLQQLQITRENVKELSRHKEKLEQANVSFRLQNIEVQEQVRKLEERNQVLEREHRKSSEIVNKLQRKINALNSKAVTASTEHKGSMRIIIEQLSYKLKDLSKQYESFKKSLPPTFKSYLEFLPYFVESVIKERKWPNKSAVKNELTHIKSDVATLRQVQLEVKQLLLIDFTPQTQAIKLAITNHLRDQKRKNQGGNMKNNFECDKIKKDVEILKEQWEEQKKSIIKQLAVLREFTVQKMQQIQQKNDLENNLQIIAADAQQREQFQQNYLEPQKDRTNFEQILKLEHLQSQVSERESSTNDQFGPEQQKNAILSDFGEEKEIDNINYVLDLLKRSGSGEPNLPYAPQIRANFVQIKNKLSRQALHLDFSGVESKPQAIGSPCSVNINEFQFQRERTNTQNHEDLGGSRGDSWKLLQSDLNRARLDYEKLNQKYNILEQRYREIKAERDEFEIKSVQLENTTSIKALENIFNKLFKAVLEEKSEMFEQTCRLLMKMFSFPAKDIRAFENKIAQKKKKKVGLLSGLFGSI